ncbi:MAG: DVU0298 family protein [Candidatus Hodarchaeales archaeon]|jgi:hypothetical protein
MVRVLQSLDLMVNDAVKDRRKFKKLVSGLYNYDLQQRFLSAKALGIASKRKPEFIKSVWQRIFYAFDDAMSCWGVAEGLGEIARNIPELRGRITVLLNKFKKDKTSCQGFVWAVCRIGQVDKNKIKDFIPDLKDFLESSDVCMLGQAIWALGELNEKEASDKIKTFLNNNEETWIYENDSVKKKTISEISKEVLTKLQY